MKQSITSRISNFGRGVILLSLLAILGCAGGQGSKLGVEYIDGITQGEISRASTIRVLFSSTMGELPQQDEVKLSIDPPISGSIELDDQGLLSFTPDQALPSGQKYSAQLQVPPSATRGPIEVDFSFHTPTLSITSENLHYEVENPYLADQITIKSTIRLNDVISSEELRDMVVAQVDGVDLDDVVVESSEGGTSHRLSIRGLEKAERDQSLKLSLTTDKNNVSAQGKWDMKIPSMASFELLSSSMVQMDGQVLELVFSDPIDPDQDLRGLIEVPLLEDLSYSVRNNLVRVHSAQGWPASFELQVHPGITSQGGKRLVQMTSTSVSVARELPMVQFVGGGTIIPDTERSYVAVETRNLRALMVQAIRVPGNNLHQFSQVNELDETNELQRVGQVVWQEVIELPWEDEYTDQTIRHGLDLSQLIRDYDPGLYHIILTFRRPHIVYPTDRDYSSEPFEFPAWAVGPEVQAEDSYWDWYSYNERRQQRFNPSNDAFYQSWSDHNITKSRNLLVSNVGLMAQRDQSGRVWVQAMSLDGATALSGARAEVLSYQQAVIGSATLGPNGDALIEVAEGAVPFSVRVQQGDEIGYLRLMDRDALNISHFDVGGKREQIAVQGVLYGERDVWRPGDTIHMTFVLKDRYDQLPDNHPVSYRLINPQGTEIYSATQTRGLEGMYYFPAATSPEAPTGAYRAVVEVGPHRFERQVRVETVIPNRLRIAVSLDNESEVIDSPRFAGTIASEWLYGAPARDLEASMEVNVSAGTTSFENYPDYVFDDPTRYDSSASANIFEGVLDENGEARFDQRLTVNNAPGFMNATIVSRVFEPSGVFSSEFYTQTYSPYDSYVGIKVPQGDAARNMLLTDVVHNVDVAKVNANGTNDSGRVRMELYKLEWKWWWETDFRGEPNFFRHQTSTPILNETIEVSRGRGEFDFEIQYPSWGRYILYATDLDSGHRTAQIMYIDWPGWAGRSMEAPGDSPSVLSASAGQSSYRVGDVATINLPLGNQGRALVFVEANGRIQLSDWVEPSGPSTRYQFRVTEAMLPNLYVHVAYVQPYMADNDRPIRSYGVVPVEVNDPSTRLYPVIETAETYEPGSTVEIEVTERDGRPMAYTLAIVDEGLLGLTRYQTPNLWPAFYEKTASLLKSFDLYNQIATPYGGELSNLLTIGGSDAGQGAQDDPLSRFEPVVIFQEPQRLNAGQSNTHRVEIPQYLGAVRVMVVATEDDAFGQSDVSVTVKKPLMALGTVPRILSPGDRLDLPVSIFALEESIDRVFVQVRTDGLISTEGSTFQTIFFDSPGDQLVTFQGSVANQAGSGTITFIARGGDQIAEYSVPVEVRMPTSPETRSATYTIEGGESLRVPVQAFGIGGTNDLTLELSRFEPLNLEGRLGYLIRYPYGCLEQTTSSVFPQLYLDRITDLSIARQNEINSNINRGIKRIQSFINADGSMSFWPGSGIANQWASIYAGHFLIEARNRGFFVPEALIDPWITYQSNAANQSSPSSSADQLTQAYRLYALALAGEPAIGAMNRLADRSNISDLAAWRLAAAYSLMGNRSQANSLARTASNPNFSFINQEDSYGTIEREKAMVADAMVQMGRSSEARDLIEELSSALASDESYATQTLAYMLLAIGREAQNNRGEPISATYNWRGDSQQVDSSSRISTISLDSQGLANGDRQNVNIQNRSRDRLYAKLITSGNPSLGTERPSSNGYSISVTYAQDGHTIDIEEPLRGGESITASVTVRNTSGSERENTALAYVIPTGWEIVNSRLSGGPRNSSVDYQDVRDDRVYSFFTIGNRQTMTFDFELVPTYRGTFYHPAVVVEAMYAPQYSARTEGLWVSVVDSEDRGR